jgi:hypothetical protein
VNEHAEFIAHLVSSLAMCHPSPIPDPAFAPD